jgi:cytochrome c556
MTKLLTTLATLILIAAPFAVQPTHGDDDQEHEKQASVWMKQKLSASQNILAGLTKGDFEAIDKNAQSMLVVEYLEKWLRADTPGYNMKLKDFEYANKSLRLAAREKNLDGATIAYIQLTLSCVHCHKLVRDTEK